MILLDLIEIPFVFALSESEGIFALDTIFQEEWAHVETGNLGLDCVKSLLDILIGNPAKAKEKLGWAPTTLFEDLVKEMTLADLADIDKGADDTHD